MTETEWDAKAAEVRSNLCRFLWTAGWREDAYGNWRHPQLGRGRWTYRLAEAWEVERNVGEDLRRRAQAATDALIDAFQEAHR